MFNLFTRYNYRVYYTETCKVCKGVRNGYFDNPMPSTENWADFRAALQSIVDMSPEQLQSFADNDILGYGKHYLMIPANMLSLIYEATGTNEMNYANLDSEFLLNFTNTSDEGSCKMFDKDGKEIASHKPDDKKSVTPTGADRITASVGNGDEDEGALESELETWSFTDEDGAALGVSTDLLMSLEDGEHTLTACFSNENGDRAAVTMLFTIYTADDGQKAIKDLHPQGTMINADGDVVSMNISKNTLIYTGESLELPSVTMTSEMGVEYAEDEDYTLTYYQVVEDENGEFTEVEIDREQITEIGTYNVVANPTRNGVLSGSAWAQFVVNTPLLGDTNQDGIVTISDVTAIQRVLAELESFSDLQMLLADANQDGEVNITDATTIQRYLAEFVIPYPIGKPIG
ncbi:MAG: dockerin type I repeat-containing protein [Ruminococcus sp.]|nr:dockerin type I repeat-containing protein [Ruminococcus sp.]